MTPNMETKFKVLKFILVGGFGRTGGMHHPVLPQTEARIESLRDSSAKIELEIIPVPFPHRGDHHRAPEPRGSKPFRRIGRRSSPSPGSRAPVAMPPCRSCGGDHPAA